MQRSPISPFDLSFRNFDLWENQWLLLTAGDFAQKRFNCMTISWGSFGILWGRPIAMIVVRPQRYTYEFTEEFDNFTLSVFPPQHHRTLEVLGSKSGRRMDKVNNSGLTAIASNHISSPGFAEAELIAECRKIYFHDFDPRNFLADYIQPNYNRDYHRMYFGEIVAVSASETYRAK